MERKSTPPKDSRCEENIGSCAWSFGAPRISDYHALVPEHVNQLSYKKKNAARVP